MPAEPGYQPESQDDVLSVGRRRRFPRWAIVVTWVAVAALVVTGIVTRGGSLNPSAKPKPRPTTPEPSITAPLAVGDSDGDLAVAGPVLYELSQGALYQLDISDPTAPSATGVATISGLDRGQANATFHVVLDLAQQHVWVVTYGASSSTVIEFDARDLKEIGRLLWPSQVHAAVAFGGHLYLASTNAVVDVASAQAQPVVIARLTGQYSGLAADPVRSRLLLLGEDSGLRVVTYSPASGLVTRGPVAPFGKGDLLVVGDAIWVGGFGAKGAVLARLDPVTLRPTTFSELSPQLGPGAVPVAAGDQVLWVRSGAGGEGLWCVDASTGNQLQYWQYDGAVTSARGVAFVAERAGPLALQLTYCPG